MDGRNIALWHGRARIVAKVGTAVHLDPSQCVISSTCFVDAILG